MEENEQPGGYGRPEVADFFSCMSNSASKVSTFFVAPHDVLQAA
jgi:hypothetical protein